MIQPRTFLVLALALTPSILMIALVHAEGTLYVSPAQTPMMSVGSTFSIKIKVSSMDTYQGWQMQVVTDPTVINATGFTLGFADGTYFEAVHCINGNGTGCSSRDGSGIVDSAVALLPPLTGSPNGVLFTIQYQVIGTGTYSAIQISNDIIANGNNGGQAVPHLTTNGQYGSKADFAISASPPSLVIDENSTGTVTINVSSLNSFSGTVLLQGSSNEPSLTISLEKTSVFLAPSGYNSSVLHVSSSASTPATSYTVTINAVSGTRSHPLTVTVGVTPNSYFVIGVSPGQLMIHAGNSSSAVVTVASRFGFSGTVTLTAPVNTLPGVQASLSNSVLNVPSGGEANSTLSISTPPSYLRFRYAINITATGGSQSQMATLIIIPPFGDISLSLNPSSIGLKPGDSANATITVSTHDYLWGTVNIAASMLGGTAKLNSTSFTFAPIGTTSRDFSIRVSVASATAPGSYNLTLTVYTFCFTPTQQPNNCGPGDKTLSHSENFNVIVSSTQVSNRPSGPASILGLAPLSYFGILGVFAAIFVALVVQTYRRRREE